MPEAVRDAFQVHPAGLALWIVDRAAARIPRRVSVGESQALDEGLAVRNVGVKRRLPVVVVEAS